MQISEVEIILLGPKCKFPESKFVIGAKIPGKGMAAVAIGCILCAVQLGGGAKAGGFCPAPEVAAKQVSIHPTAVGSRT